MKKVVVILLLATVAFADNYSNLIDLKVSLDKQLENNTYQKEVDVVYEALKSMKAVDVEVPKYESFKESQDKFVTSLDLPTLDKVTDDESCLDPELLGDYRIYVFISSSVPNVTLKNYMRDALKLGDTLLLLRGVIGSADYIIPTQNFITRLACNKDVKDIKTGDKCDVSRVDINPQLFTFFSVEKAPAIVFTKLTYHEIMLRINMGQTITEDEYYIIRGDNSIKFALEEFQRYGADVQKQLDKLYGEY